VGSTCQRRFPSLRALPLPLCLVGPGCRHRLPSPARSSPSLPRRPASLDAELFPRAPALSLSRCAMGPPCQLRLPRAPSWTSTRAPAPARRDPRPCRSPTHPSSFLSTARTRTRTRSPAPFHASSPSLALFPRCSTSPVTSARRANHPARRKLRPATPSSAPR
jgi:hypothetical protein